VIDTVMWVVKQYELDENRVYLCGNSMGGSGSLGIGMRHGNVFAAIKANVPAKIEHVSQRREYDTTVDTSGFSVIGAYKHHARQVTTHYAGYELGARYVDVDDDAIVLTSHQLQAGGTYVMTPQLRVQSNVLIPIGDDQPRHSVRWWSRLQFNF